jgi:hypothetical protein
MPNNCGSGGSRTTTPNLFHTENMFSQDKSTAEFFANLPSMILGSLGTFLGQAGSVVRWIVAVYLVVVIVIMVVLWIYSLVRYYKSVMSCVATIKDFTTVSPLIVLAWSLSILLLSIIILSPILALLWPLWIPFLILGFVIWILSNIAQTILVCACVLYKIADYVVFPTIKRIYSFVRRIVVWITWKVATRLVPKWTKRWEAPAVHSKAVVCTKEETLLNDIQVLCDNNYVSHRIQTETDHNPT